MDTFVGNNVLNGGRKYNNGEIKENVCRKPPKTYGFGAKINGFHRQTLSELVHT